MIIRLEVNLKFRFEKTTTFFHLPLRVLILLWGLSLRILIWFMLRGGVGNFQNEIQMDNSDPLSFSPVLVLVSNIKAFK